MKIQNAVEGPLHVFRDREFPQAKNALAGPFESSEAAAWYLVQQGETKLTEAQKATWGTCLAQAGGVRADPWQLLTVLRLIAKNRDAALIARCARPLR